MGYYIKYALVVKATTHKERVKEILDAVPAVVEVQGDFFFIQHEYKYGWEEVPAVAAAVQTLMEEFDGAEDAIVAVCYKAVGEEGEEVGDTVFESAGHTGLQDETWDDPYGWVVVYGDQPQVGSVYGIEFVYVDLDTGTVINGPIAKVPVNRLTEDMGDSAVIAASQPYRIWNI